MRIELIFPSILMVLDIAAAIVYAYNGKWWMAGYWFAAFILTLCVVMGMDR